MSSLEIPDRLTPAPQPLRHAEALLTHLADLAHATGSEPLLAGLVRAAAQLSGCELSQLYLLDDTHTRLWLCAEWHDGLLQPRETASLPSDYDGEQLLQYCLCQNRRLFLDELDSRLHNTGFLPVGPRAWRSLLCCPVVDKHGKIGGLLVLASRQPQALQGVAEAVGRLGSFAFAQLKLLRRLHAAQDAGPIATPPCASGYGLIGVPCIA